MSDTTIDVPLSKLLGERHVILIYKKAEISTCFACRNIVAGRFAARTGAGGAASEPLAVWAAAQRSSPAAGQCLWHASVR